MQFPKNKVDTSVKVCIADDHQLFRESVIRNLNDMDGIKVLFGAANGQDLLDQLKNSKPEVIILDINMPVMNGVQALAKIKTDYPEIKVIMLSMHSHSIYITELFNMGANSFLPKNCLMDELEMAIKLVYKQGFYHTEHVEKVLENNLTK